MSLAPTQARPSDASSTASETTRQLRVVHRAASELRRGVPVLLTGNSRFVVQAAETAGPDGLRDLASWGLEPPLLLLAPTRAASVLRRPVEQSATAVALRVPPATLRPEILRALADPMLDPVPADALEPVPAPALASAALRLAKLARVLPAVLMAPASF